MNLPTNLPPAQLPQLYQSAKQAIAQCDALDECHTWSDKAAALASYAKQANDFELETTARRIRGRAIERCGVLIAAIPAAPTIPARNPDGTVTAGAHNNGRWATAEAAGLSPWQIRTALDVASIPKPLFEEMIERPKAPTVQELQAACEKNLPRLHPNEPIKTEKEIQEFQAATQAIAALRRFTETIKLTRPIDVIRGGAQNKLEIQILSNQAIAWLEEIRKLSGA
jgi:hypothetical protein